MQGEVTIETRNCRGLADRVKRWDILDKIRTDKVHIACLQDVHLEKKDRNRLKQEWGGTTLLSAKSSASRGVAVLFSKNLEFKIHNSKSDTDGNYIIIDLSVDGLPRFTYFFENIWKEIEAVGNSDVVACGDWNVVRDYRKDTHNYARNNNPKAREVIRVGMEKLELVDVWREKFLDSFKFTWGTNKPIKKARLDYFLISQALFNVTKECNIMSKYRSDHAPVTLTLTTSEHVIGPGLWKLNIKLLENKEIEQQILNEILLMKRVNAATPYNPDYVESCPNVDIQLMIDDSLFWETLLVQLRGVLIKFAAAEKRKRNKHEKTLTPKISKLERECNNEESDRHPHELLEEANKELEQIRKAKVESLIFRNRAQWVEQGDKSTRFFLQSQKSNCVNRTIKQLEKEDLTNITDQKEILEYIKQFYKDLYSERPREIPLEQTMAKLDLSGLSTLSKDLQNQLEGDLTLAELTRALKSSKNNKSPGPDGYPVEFYKHFWSQLGPFLLRALNFSFSERTFSTSQTQGIITSIPKGNKDRKFLKNWRPISLLNSSYKLASTCIANRIKPILPQIIKPQQKGFIHGREISECTREIYDCMYEYEVNEDPGMLLLIDFEKAFDSIAWDFIHFTLKKFEFPQNILEWISMVQKNAESRVTQSGWVSDPFQLHRGCRQGDPLSPYVFILCAEILSQAFINNKEVVGLKIGDREQKLTQFADDTTLFLDGSKKALRKSISLLNIYEEASGLKMNLSKTKAIWIGSKRFSREKICHEVELDWVQTFTALGIKYDVTNLCGITDLNCATKMAEVEKILLNWSRTNTTLAGRVLVIKSLALSKLVHFFIALPTPPKEFMRNINKTFYYFLWKGKPPKIKSKTMELNIEDGGLKMVNIARFEETLKIKWLKKVVLSKEIWTNIPIKYGIDQICKFGPEYPKQILCNIKNPFWSSVVNAVILFQAIHLEDHPVILPHNEPIWFNPILKIPYTKKWDTKGLRYVGDLLDDTGSIKSREQIKKDFGIAINFIDYRRVTRTIPFDYCIAKEDTKLNSPWCQRFLLSILNDNKTNQIIKKVMLNNNKTIPTAVNRWNETLFIPEEFSFWKKIFSLPNKCTQSKWLQMFQYKLLHRILPTNKNCLNIVLKHLVIVITVGKLKCPSSTYFVNAI